ncbi:MAG: right-handed parallel beta-helix repeat-containing protein, partial [Candidatus Hatepunaea meridiana]|nr:right-handed parallel beta-helix repeat-containing protein [Candidatus Hatepunaea meridiana]
LIFGNTWDIFVISENSSLNLMNCTISGNGSDNREFGIFCYDASIVTMNNCIYWNNTTPGIRLLGHRDEPDIATISYTLFEGGEDAIDVSGNSEVNWGEGNIDANPLFVDPDEGDYHLTADSPCIDAGDPDSPEDPDGTRTDMGAYYFHQEPDHVLHVPDEYETIQAAIDAAADGDTVLVDPGEYVENIDFDGNNIVVASLFLTTGDEDYIEQTIIDGDEDGSAVTFENEESEDAVLVGITIQNGSAGSGGGIYCFGSNPTISFCNINSNTSESNGGGILCRNSESNISNCTISGNTAQSYGGGIFGRNSNLNISHCTIKDNETTGNGGGGIGFWESSPTVSYCSITGNSSNSHSGAIYCHNRSNITIQNCTINGNTARSNAGVSRLSLESRLSVVNSIIWDNTQQQEYTVWSFSNGDYGPDAFVVSYTDFEGGQGSISVDNNDILEWGDGNIDSNPLFVDSDNDDYHLTWENYPEYDESRSPCIDAGDPDSDNDPDDTRADMGAYYFIYDPAPDISVRPEAIAFGDVPVNQEAELELTILNLGDEDLWIRDFRGVLGDCFSIMFDVELEFEIGADEEYPITVYFEPDSPGDYEVELIIVSNDPNEEELIVPLSGTGAGGPPEIREPIDDQQLNEDFDPYIVANLEDVFFDPDDDELTFEVESSDEHLVVEIVDDTQLQLSSDANWYGEATVTVTASDDDGGRDRGPIRRLRRLNDHPGRTDIPVCQLNNLNAVRDGALTDLSNRCQPDVVDSNLPAVDGTLTALQDGAGVPARHSPPHRDLSTQLEFLVTVAEINDDPVWTEYPGDPVEILVGEQVQFDLEATDVDEDDLTIEWDRGDLPDEAELDIRGNGIATLTWETEQDDEGEYHPTFTVSDGDAEVDITVDIVIYVMRELSVSFLERWNITSLNIMPPQEMYRENEQRGPDIWLMIQQLRIDQNRHHVISVNDNWGHFCSIAWEWNSIPYWNLQEGYRFNMNNDVETVWTGVQIPYDADIPMVEGWNIIAYYPTYELDASSPDFYVISSIVDHIIIIKDGNGSFMVPSRGFSSMPPWYESQGYQICVDEDLVFNYPEEQDREASADWSRTDFTTGHWTVPIRSDRNMSVLVTALPQNIAHNGSEIAAFNASGELTGAGVIKDGSCGFPIWGDIPSTEAREGLLKDEAFELKIWDGRQPNAVDNEKRLETTSIIEGEGLVYRTDDLLILTVSVASETANSFFLSEACPNPFNAITRFTYGVSCLTNVSISVYDLKGQLVETLINDKQSAGTYTINWNSRGLSSGLYIVRLNAEGFSMIRKVVLTK